MRVLYLSRWWSHHDRRFVAAWQDGGDEVLAVSVDGEAPSDAGPPVSGFEERAGIAMSGFAPDVVHAGPLTDVAAIAAARWDGPLIAMSWGFDLMDEVDRDARLRKRAVGVLDRADVILVDNDAPRRKAIELGAAPSRITQFPWGIDIGFFTPGASTLRRRLGWTEDEVMVLATRKHEAIYGVDVLVDAFLRAAGAAPRLRLALAGGGSETDSLRNRVAEAGCADRVAFLGELGQPDLRDAHRAADLYVSSSYVDGTSVSLLEAMACGTPVCVSAIPGNAEWVTALTGTTFEPGDTHGLATVLERLASGDADFAAQLSARADQALIEVRERADWSRNSAQLPALARAAQQRHSER